MSKQRHRQPRDAAPPRGPQWAYASLLASSSAGAAGQAPCPEVPAPEPPLPREDAMLGITDAIARISMTAIMTQVNVDLFYATRHGGSRRTSRSCRSY